MLGILKEEPERLVMRVMLSKGTGRGQRQDAGKSLEGPGA